VLPKASNSRTPPLRTTLRTTLHTTRRAMQEGDLDAVLALEVQCYSHPWSRGNFSDSLASGYCAQVLERVADAPARGAGLGAPQPLLGYFVAMAGADEWHLLNICIGPDWQGQGLGTALLAAVAAQGRALGLARWLLEVRASNTRARALYARHGFTEDGLRRAYYPGVARREDAVLMSRSLALETPTTERAPHALG
jgi:[ribosomal protein S18]-alanine N-acetyltransferase